MLLDWSFGLIVEAERVAARCHFTVKLAEKAAKFNLNLGHHGKPNVGMLAACV